MDWTEVLAAEDENKRARLAAELVASNSFGSTAERVEAFACARRRSAGEHCSTTNVGSEAGTGSIAGFILLRQVRRHAKGA